MLRRLVRRLVQWLQPAALLLSMLAIGWFLSSQLPSLRAYPWQIDGGWLVAAAFLTLASWGVEIFIWQHLLVNLGGNLPFWAAVRIWFLSAVVRYIPGNVWQPLSLTLYSRRYGVAPEVTLTSIILFQVIVLFAIAPILVIYFLWIDTQSLAAQFMAQLPPGLLWLLLLPIVLFLLRPQWMVALLNWTLVRLKRPTITATLTSRLLFTMLIVATLDWLLWGATFAALAFAIAGEGVVERAMLAPLLIASYPIAYAIGFLSIITPSGFGVREGAMYLLLTPQIDGAVVTVIALAIRIWATVGELLIALISAPIQQAVGIVGGQEADADIMTDTQGHPFTPKSIDLIRLEPEVDPDLHSKTT